MALVIKDRVLETCSSPGSGTVTLLGAVTGYQTFNAAVSNGNTCYYTIADQSGSNWEVGVGTFSSPASLARTTILASSNGGLIVNFSTGVQNVFLTYPAGKAVTTDTLAYPPAIGGTTPAAGSFTVLTATADSAFTSTGAVQISKGTTGQQPGSPATGMFRYNTTTNQFEGYSGASPGWSSLGGITIADDTTSASTYYPVFTTTTGGSITAEYVSSTHLTFKPSTGDFTVYGISTASSFGAKSGAGGTITLSPASTASSYTLTLPAKNGTVATTADIIPSGSVTNFFQAAAPTNWTKVTTNNDAAIRIVSGTGGGTGGSVGFTTAFASQATSGTVGGFTLSTYEIPSHNHYGNMTFNSPAGGGGPIPYSGVSTKVGDYYAGVGINSPFNVASQGGGGSHNHSFSGAAINLAVKYLDNIMCSKD
jgi:hypothetical protein